MSYDRVLGQHVELHILSGSNNILIGEIDSVSGTDKSTLLENQPLYQVVPRAQVVPGGWELACKGGKINGALQAAILDRDNHLYIGKASPRYTLTVTTHYYGGTYDTYSYCDGVIHGFKFDASKADQAVTEDFTFTASYRLNTTPGATSNKPNLNPDPDYGTNGAPPPG